MKTITFIVLLLLCVSGAFAQKKGELGVYTEGSWFMPKEKFDMPLKNGIGIGAGVYYSRPVIGKLSASIGVGYQFKSNKGYTYSLDYYENYYENDYGYGGYTGGSYDYGSWKTFPQHYLVVPLKFKYTLKNNFFITSGVDASWLLNYDTVNEKPECNWLVGFGSKIGDLQWTVNYTEGFSKQAFGNFYDGSDIYGEVQGLKNRMLSVNLSYPLWKF